MIMQTSRVPAGRKKILRRNLAAMNADGFSFSVMVGLGETYLPAFVLSRHMGDLTVALIASVPILLGSLLQLAAPLILGRVRSYRKFAVGAAVLQAISLLVLVGLAMTPDIPAWSVFLPATVYWAAGLSVGPAWNAWAEQIVPVRIRPGFFARRSRLCHIGVLAGLVSGGLLLRFAESAQWPFSMFAVLFGVGAAGRFVSAAMLARQSESRDVSRRCLDQPYEPLQPAARLRSILTAVRHPGPIGRFVIFLMAVQTGVYVSGPYFTAYMLRTLDLSWGEYMGLLSLGFIGKMLSLPWAGRLANRHGADKLLLIGGLGIVPTSALWVINQSVGFLVFVQIFSGMMWGCYELGMLLQFFRQIPTHRRVRILTLYNLGNSAAMVAGTLIGGAILKYLGSDASAYLTVFLASSVCRGTAMLLLPGRQKAMLSTRTAVHGWIRRTVRTRLPLPADESRERIPVAARTAAADTAIDVEVNPVEFGELPSVTPSVSRPLTRPQKSKRRILEATSVGRE